MGNQLVSIILVNYMDPTDTLACLESLNAVTYSPLEVVVVDNGTTEDRSHLYKAAYAESVVVNREENGGFAAGVNSGIDNSKGEFILLLNNDTIVTPGFIEPLVEVFSRDENIGLASSQIRFFDNRDTLQYAGASNIHPILGRGKKRGYNKKVSEEYNVVEPTELCNGACMMIHRHVLEDVGKIPENYFMYYEEHDFTHRAKRLGWKCYYVGTSVIYHKAAASLGLHSPLRTYYLLRNRLLYQRRFQSGVNLIASTLFMYLIVYPKAIINRLIKRDFKGIKSVLDASAWHLLNRVKKTT